MSKLRINDLDESQEMDRRAMARIVGGARRSAVSPTAAQRRFNARHAPEWLQRLLNEVLERKPGA